MRRRGFTVIEVLMAATVLMIATTAAFMLIAASLRNIDRNNRRALAHDFLQTAASVIRNTPFTSLTSQCVSQGLLPLWNARCQELGTLATYSVSLQVEDPNLYQVRCQVSGDFHGTALILGDTTLRVSDRGINP